MGVTPHPAAAAGPVGEIPGCNPLHHQGAIIFTETELGTEHHCFLVGLKQMHGLE